MWRVNKKGQHWAKNFKKSPEHERTGKDGYVYDSKQEMKRGEHLLGLQRNGAIRNLKRQFSFDLIIEGRPIKTPSGRRMKYKADFVYEVYSCGEWSRVVEDVKGYYDAKSRLKIAVFEAIYDCKVEIIEK